MQITYHNSDTKILIGDHVEFKTAWLFWRGWQKGRIEYVPGISPQKADMEHNGLTWVCVCAEGMKLGVIVNPETQQLKKSVRFIKRTDDELKETPKDFEFESED